MALRHDDTVRTFPGDDYWSAYVLAMIDPEKSDTLLAKLDTAGLAPGDATLLSGPEVLAALVEGDGVLAAPDVDRMSCATAAWRGDVMLVVYVEEAAQRRQIEQIIVMAGGGHVRYTAHAGRIG